MTSMISAYNDVLFFFLLQFVL